MRCATVAVVVALLSSLGCAASGDLPDKAAQSETRDALGGNSVNGVTFFYLDGGAQDFPWVLAHQHEPSVRARLEKTFEAYRANHVNWIRVLVAADHLGEYGVFPAGQNYPNRAFTNTLLTELNEFMALTRAGESAGQFTIEVVLMTPRYHGAADDRFNDYFADSPSWKTTPYLNDKAWFTQMINGMDYSNLGMVLIGGDLSPCGWNGSRNACYGDGDVVGHAWDHGIWLANMWPWVKATWPNLNASYEVIAGDPYQNHDLIKRTAAWADQFTPSLSTLAASLYLTTDDPSFAGLPPGSSAEAWRKVMADTLDAYASVTSKPLWVDEYGQQVGTRNGYSEADQRNAYVGILSAFRCSSTVISQFAWAPGSDFLSMDYEGDTPKWRPAWADVGRSYGSPACDR